MNWNQHWCTAPPSIWYHPRSLSCQSRICLICIHLLLLLPSLTPPPVFTFLFIFLRLCMFMHINMNTEGGGGRRSGRRGGRKETPLVISPVISKGQSIVCATSKRTENTSLTQHRALIEKCKKRTLFNVQHSTIQCAVWLDNGFNHSVWVLKSCCSYLINL